MTERLTHLPAESAGRAPGRGRLTGRRVLVVGGGQTDIGEADTPIGNGRAISVLCAREGATIAVADRDRESAEATCGLIAVEKGKAFALAADVARETDVVHMVREAADAMGGLDGLVLNVGIGDGVRLKDMTVEAWDRTFAVNLRGHMLCVREALPKLGPGAAIVFISSIAALVPGSRLPSYDASKAALAALMRETAREGARGCMRANVVLPGLMDTSIGRLATRGRPNRAETHVPLGRQGTGWETAYAVLFLLSDESAYVTGQSLIVDGGLTGLR